MTTLAINQCLERATALLRARVIFLWGELFLLFFLYSAYTFSLFFSFLCIFSDIFINLMTYKKL